MQITLSWDLFVIVFFALVCGYSFIIGKHQAIKVIVATYIAIVSGQAIGNLLERLTDGSKPLLSSFGLTINLTVLSGTKMFIFVAVIILLAVRGGLDISYGNQVSRAADLFLTLLFGIATGGLLLSTIITFIADAPLLETTTQTTAALSPIIQESRLMQVMLVYQELWFSLPALLLIGVGLMDPPAE